MKKFLSLLLAVMMLLGCIPAMAEAGTFTANAKTYMITSYKGTDENLVVPASVDGAPTPIIHDRALNGAKKAVTLSFEEGVTQIRSMNIASMDITKLTLPSTLEVIASNNIYQTDKLTEVTVPAAVSYVGTLSFSYCDVLTKVTFTGLCPVFGPRPFVSTAKDLVVYVPDDQLDAYKAALPEGLNVQPSGKKAVDARVRVAESDFEFDAATGTIKKYTGTASYIEIPATIGGVQVKTIGQKAFYQHPFMTVVIIPEGVETLEMYSIFAGKGLYCVEFPSTLKTIGKNALWASELDSLTLPEGLETIGESAFASAINKIDELVIPDSVTSIGKEAFYSCMPVKVVIGANVQSLPEASFSTLHNVTEIVIRNKNGMTIDPKAFQSSKKGTTITLMDGITEEVYNSYVEQLTVAYASAKVNQPELAASFPTLDAEAGAPFIGNWTAVAVTDGTDFYGMDLLDMSMNVVLNDDGTGTVDMDDDTAPGGWYVEDGAAIFAPILEEGGQPVPEEAMPFTLDENGRMCLDLGGMILLMEKEGVEYAVPAIPEKPWPELDADKTQYYVGTWDAVSYIVDGDTYPAELVGPTTLILNADGTAQMIEGEEEAYELRWYAESYSAYVGPAMSALVEIYFDMNGNLQMMQDGSMIVFVPHVDVKVIEGADELLGDWYDDVGNKLTLVNDGTLTHTYSFDGWVDTYAWDVVDGAAVVTEGPWSGLPITLENGILIITNDEGIFQIFSRDGDLSAYYGEDDEDDMPEAQPIGAEGEPYFGAW
ncbi:MAG: leucine-rich repeat protein [Clostridia bacterium]|nr:leucine-rich repeat protein [Clostridia bacterium]